MANAKRKEAPFTNEDVDVLEISSIEDEMLEMLGIELDPNKKYMFELVDENPVREMPVFDMREKRYLSNKRFKPYHNIVFTSQIVWKNKRTTIRYYDGCDSIFVSKQPKEKEIIEQYINQTRSKNYHFRNGLWGVHGDEKMLLTYMFVCSWNDGSPFKTRTSQSIFISKDENKNASSISKKIDEQEKALSLAKEAKKKKMLIHANYLQIPTVDWDSGNELSDDSIRAEYRKYALENPSKFIETYNDAALEMKYYIDEALRNGAIRYANNRATWSTGTDICNVDGLKTNEGISAELIKFAQSEAGEEFVIQLKALSE